MSTYGKTPRDATESKKLDHALMWLDLETTGLDPDKGVILEACAILTDQELNEIRRKKFVVGHAREDIISMMDDYVLTMHLNNGLLKEVWAALNRVSYVDENLAAMCGCWELSSKCNVYLAGSSIHFDRRWIMRHMLRLHKALHYRMLDVSTYHTAFPGLLKKPKSGSHRAEADIENSIDLHRQMREVVAKARQAEAATRARDPLPPKTKPQFDRECMDAYEADMKAKDEPPVQDTGFVGGGEELPPKSIDDATPEEWDAASKAVRTKKSIDTFSDQGEPR